MLVWLSRVIMVIKSWTFFSFQTCVSDVTLKSGMKTCERRIFRSFWCYVYRINTVNYDLKTVLHIAMWIILLSRMTWGKGNASYSYGSIQNLNFNAYFQNITLELNFTFGFIITFPSRVSVSNRKPNICWRRNRQHLLFQSRSTSISLFLHQLRLLFMGCQIEYLRALAHAKHVYWVVERKFPLILTFSDLSLPHVTYGSRRGSSVSIVSDYGLDDRAIGVRSPAGAQVRRSSSESFVTRAS
jgi:hypothetical protein